MAPPDPVNTSASPRGAGEPGARLRLPAAAVIPGLLCLPLAIFLWARAPRAVRPPARVPLPALSEAQMARSLRADDEAAARVEPGPALDELRQRLRALGEAEATEGTAPPPLLAAVRESFARFAVAADARVGAIAGVRAKLATEFVRAVRARDAPEVRALGGAFLRNALPWGILHGDGSLDVDRCSPFLLRALYKARLALLAGDPADAPLLGRAERIAVESFVLGGAGRAPGAPIASLERRARALEGLAALDPAYPAHLAGGVFFARAERSTEAQADLADAEANLMEHLAAHPRDARARNYLIWVRRRLDPAAPAAR